MNVTQEIRNNHIIYGASDYTAPQSLAASKSLNYARGASLNNPETASCTVAPFTFQYDGDVGLFGAENYFIKVELNVIGDIAFACYEETGWSCADINDERTRGNFVAVIKAPIKVDLVLICGPIISHTLLGSSSFK